MIMVSVVKPGNAQSTDHLLHSGGGPLPPLGKSYVRLLPEICTPQYHGEYETHRDRHAFSERTKPLREPSRFKLIACDIDNRLKGLEASGIQRQSNGAF